MSRERTDLVRAEENAAEWREEAASLRGVLNAIRDELGLSRDPLPSFAPPETPPEVLAIRAAIAKAKSG